MASELLIGGAIVLGGFFLLSTKAAIDAREAGSANASILDNPLNAFTDPKGYINAVVDQLTHPGYHNEYVPGANKDVDSWFATHTEYQPDTQEGFHAYVNDRYPSIKWLIGD